MSNFIIRLSDASRDLQRAAVAKWGYGILQTGYAEKVEVGWIVFDSRKNFLGVIDDWYQDQVSQVSDTTLKEHWKNLFKTT